MKFLPLKVAAVSRNPLAEAGLNKFLKTVVRSPCSCTQNYGENTHEAGNSGIGGVPGG